MDDLRVQAHNAKFLALNAAIREGLNSGVSDKTVPQVMEEVEARLRARAGPGQLRGHRPRDREPCS